MRNLGFTANVAFGQQLLNRYAARVPHISLRQKYFSTTTRSGSSKCPFTVLGVKQLDDENNIPYKNVKDAFVQLALKYHPDRPGGSAEKFLTIRQALESIQELPCGGSRVRRTTGLDEEEQYHYTDEELQGWMRQHESLDLSFYMDAKTRREITQVVHDMQPSGLDRGGMWEMARAVAQREEEHPTPDDPKQLNSGAAATTSSTRRRRR